ncbi:CaiB/BaiF CoA transferase family protein [Rhodococcus wratislaviensis]|uniref:CaiB/BaiF family protein n=1 Tax=Rhodococcus wratislaviensis NBRC 100605 TaxID=1219028 RepID=X0R9E4_RHOWR|nr:CoA transferase [Rhodococcus wratislaviensis]GAF47610.1 CaiB/BaiF family protein [Rhodococcus wratislaviensis NBRC 100605]
MTDVESTEERSAGALSGIRVVDLSQIAAGPYATSLLGDFGADVIKVEPPSGDPLRQIDNAFGEGESAYSFSVNRSKRSVRIDVKSPDGRAVLDRLLAEADVFVISMRPAAARRLGLNYESVSERFPRLVYCSITGYGEDGPLVDRPGMDLLAQARGGTMGTTGEPGRTPVKVAPAIADFLGSYLACNGILLALRVRDRDGIGQKVGVNLLDGQVSLLPNLSVAYHRTGVPFRPQGGAQSNIVPYQVFETSDGWVVVACLIQKFWVTLCRAVERPDLVEDPRFSTNADRVRNRGELVPVLAALFAEHPTSHWMKILEAGDVPCSPVNALEDVFVDPQVVHNGMTLVLTHPRHGEVVTVNNPIHLGSTPAQPRGYPPDAGEHTDEVLAEYGYDTDQIRTLRAGGAVL